MAVPVRHQARGGALQRGRWLTGRSARLPAVSRRSQLRELAHRTGVSGYVGDGAERWPAVHRAHAARLVRLALGEAPADSAVHAVGEEGISACDIAEAIGRRPTSPSCR